MVTPPTFPPTFTLTCRYHFAYFIDRMERISVCVCVCAWSLTTNTLLRGISRTKAAETHCSIYATDQLLAIWLLKIISSREFQPLLAKFQVCALFRRRRISSACNIVRATYFVALWPGIFIKTLKA